MTGEENEEEEEEKEAFSSTEPLLSHGSAEPALLSPLCHRCVTAVSPLCPPRATPLLLRAADSGAARLCAASLLSFPEKAARIGALAAAREQSGPGGHAGAVTRCCRDAQDTGRVAHLWECEHKASRL